MWLEGIGDIPRIATTLKRLLLESTTGVNELPRGRAIEVSSGKNIFRPMKT